ncbi:heat shock protein 9/12-domain-containing protein [Epithele typhae]|uniref:heat shock protein 9/12-domain-containing protein n=1 Tax=Epithele typhae TaxID=378194 RepID=UPI00200791A2|nr:heat shock protein 9/12-domain-containing protein [Epithele typhae]KAH9942495.1 heat shock protein 9/12-domain-containing protein [Epithele typhae]
MSDTGRQSLTDKATAALKPDSEKSTTEHIGDKFRGNVDSAQSTMQPQNDKSTTQRMGDAVSGNQNETQPSLTQKAKDALGFGGSNN